MRYGRVTDTIFPDNIKKINELNKKIGEETNKEVVDEKKVNEMMYQQLIKGLSINGNVRNNGMMSFF
jgi:hypothetical protein